jgi:hypothetical protein
MQVLYIKEIHMSKSDIVAKIRRTVGLPGPTRQLYFSRLECREILLYLGRITQSTDTSDDPTNGLFGKYIVGWKEQFTADNHPIKANLERILKTVLDTRRAKKTGATVPEPIQAPTPGSSINLPHRADFPYTPGGIGIGTSGVRTGRVSSASSNQANAPSEDIPNDLGTKLGQPDYTIGFTGDKLMKRIAKVIAQVPDDLRKDILEIESIHGRKVRITFRL